MLLPAFALMLLGCPPIPGDDPAKPSDSADTGGDAPVDADGDGYAEGEDCDDGDGLVNPGAAGDPCDGEDNDCDGEIDEDPDVAFFPDADGDGYGASSGDGVTACDAPEGYALGQADCDDADGNSWPGADEVCDFADNDCDGEVDEGLLADVPAYLDADGDAAGDPTTETWACGVPPERVANGLDCRDDVSTIPLWVEEGGTGRGSFANPMGSIGDAMSAAEGCVVVLPGTYTERLIWPAGDVVVSSLEGPDATVIEGTGEGPVLSARDWPTLDSRFEGFTLKGGSGEVEETSVSGGGTTYVSRQYSGGGVYVESCGLTLANVVITDSALPASSTVSDGSTVTVESSFGGGVFAVGGDLVLEDVTVTDNFAAKGGAAYVVSTGLEATRLRLEGNSAEAWASVVFDDSVVRMDNLIVNANRPSTSPGGLAAYSSSLWLNHATIVSEDYGVSVQGGNLTVTNSVFEGNAYGVYGDNGTVYVSYSAFSNQTGEFANTSVEGEALVYESCAFSTYLDDWDRTNDDLTLSAGSPCIDAGDPAGRDVDGTVPDVGAYGGAAAF